MNEKQKENLIAWLNNALAMEYSLVKNMEQQVKAADEYPEIKSRLENHLEETKRHADIISSRIEDLGGDVSTVKNYLGAGAGLIQGGMKRMTEDGAIKGSLEAYAAENLEIASYNSLKAAAEDLGDMETAKACSEILKDEERMAEWYREQIPTLTKDYLNELAETN